MFGATLKGIGQLRQEMDERTARCEKLQQELDVFKERDVHRCAITGLPASLMNRTPYVMWEVWSHPSMQGAPLLLCVDSPCSFELHRRLNFHLPDPGERCDGPWGCGWTREQIISWAGNPPSGFRERTLQTMADLRAEYGGVCPLEKPREVCARCDKPAITRYSKKVPVALCSGCAILADAAVVTEAQKDRIVQATAAGDRYAWQAFVEWSPAFERWDGRDRNVALRRFVDAALRKSAVADRRQFLRDRPSEHTMTILGMADFFGPKVR